MQATDLIVEVRDANYNRIGQLLPKDLTDLTVVAKFNSIGSWKITLPSSHPLVDSLRTPGSGLIVTGPSGVILSGPTTSAKNIASQDDPKGSWEIEGKDDSIILSENPAFPTPSTNDVEAQTVAYDTRIGPAETIMKEYVSVNIGPEAPAERDVYNLIIETDEGLGTEITTSARFNQLDKLLTAISSIDKLGYTVEQSGENLIFKVYQPVDRSGEIRMDIDNDQLASTEYVYKQPELTRVIVGGSGAAEQRTFLSVETTESIAAASEWGRKITRFHDARSSQGLDELEQSGLEQLADKGSTQKAVVITPNDYTTMRYGVDWFLGDIVSVTVNNEEIIQIVTEVGLLVSSEGVTLKATVGNPIKTDLEETLIYLSGQQDERLDNLERNAEGGASAARESVVYTTPILTSGQVFKTEIEIAPDFRLLSISTTTAARVRIYSDADGQDWDENRVPTGYPDDIGLFTDVITPNNGLYSFDLSPVPFCFSRLGTATIPVTITNLEPTSNPVQVTFIFIPLS